MRSSPGMKVKVTFEGHSQCKNMSATRLSTAASHKHWSVAVVAYIYIVYLYEVISCQLARRVVRRGADEVSGGGGAQRVDIQTTTFFWHWRQLCKAFKTVEFYTVVMLQTFILFIISIPSPHHSFIPGLKPPFSANPFHRSLSFLLQGWLHRFPGLFTNTSEHIRYFTF